MVPFESSQGFRFYNTDLYRLPNLRRFEVQIVAILQQKRKHSTPIDNAATYDLVIDRSVCNRYVTDTIDLPFNIRRLC